MSIYRARNPQRILRMVTILGLILSVVAINVINAAQDHDVPVSVDGIRCDSCGSECSTMCGSRSFRACCYNYIKKRSIPWQGGSAGAGDNVENETQVSKSASLIVGGLKSNSGATLNPFKAPIIIKHQSSGSGKHIFGGYVPEIITTGSDSMQDGEVLFPMRFRDLMASMVRSLNAFENKKFGRMNLVF